MPSASVVFKIANPTDQDKPVIFVSNDPAVNPLNFTITYSGDGPAKFKGGMLVAESKITPQSPTSFYFTVSSVLSPDEYAAMTVKLPDGWQAKNLGSWVVAPVDDITVNPGDSFQFELRNITADNQPGPGSFNIDNYNVPGVANNGTQLNLSLESPPDNHKRLADYMHISFVNGDTVYIDLGDETLPPNTLVLRLDNYSQTPLVPSDMHWPNTPVFYLSFVTASGPPGYGALTTINDMKEISVSLAGDYGTKWTIQDHTQRTPPYWAIYPKSHEILGTGANAIVEFKISGIVTNFAPSSTNLYLLSSFIPGFDDGSQALPISKVSPVQFVKQLCADPSVGSHYGEPISLSWETVAASSVSVEPPINGKSQVEPFSTGTIIHPASAVSYVMTAQGPGGPATSSVNVIPIPSSWDSKQVSGLWHTLGRPVLVPDFKDNLWFYAGGKGDLHSAVFKSPDGFNWSYATNKAAYCPRGDAAGCVHGSRLWLFGGETDAGPVNEIWSSKDGVSWKQSEASGHWGPRSGLGCASFAGKLWIFGGMDGSGKLLNDVWSSPDGVNWAQVTSSATWPARTGMGVATYGGAICIIAGQSDGGPLADGWQTTDGVNWKGFGGNINWQPRSVPNVGMVGENLYVIGGINAQGQSLPDNNIFTPQGNWQLGLGPGWPESALNMSSASFLGALWFAGGTLGGASNSTVWGFGP